MTCHDYFVTIGIQTQKFSQHLNQHAFMVSVVCLSHHISKTKQDRHEISLPL